MPYEVKSVTGEVPDQFRLRKTGRRVRMRLADDPRAYKLPTEEAEIYAVGDFMTPDECAKMRTMIDEVARPSTVYDGAVASDYRTSYSGDVYPHDPFVKKINRRIDDLLGMEPEWGESIQGQRYEPGQQFQAHHDWFHPDGAYWEIEKERGGQRSYTAMVFLNEVEAGGTTDFTEIGLSIEPKPGALLCWNNADPDGVPNLKTMHAGRPVVSGIKYIITKWYRTRRWF